MGKPARQSNPNLNLLLNCTSTDETRFHLTAVHYDGVYWVATDGHRMALVTTEAMPYQQALKPTIGSTYESEALAIDVLKPIECKYPNYKQLMPDTKQSKHAFKLTIPEWISQLKMKRGKPAPTIGIDSGGQWTTGKALVYLNMAYIAEIAAMDCEVWIYIKDALSPVVIQPVPARGRGIDWTLVVMPMRGDARPVTPAVIALVDDGKLAVVK